MQKQSGITQMYTFVHLQMCRQGEIWLGKHEIKIAGVYMAEHNHMKVFSLYLLSQSARKFLIENFVRSSDSLFIFIRSNCFMRKRRNKAGYTATLVACGWAGAIFEVLWSLWQEQWGHRTQKKQTEKVKCDGRTDGPTDKKRSNE